MSDRARARTTGTSPPMERHSLHPLRRIRNVLLDVDGTLVDSNEQHVHAWKDAFQSHGRLVTVEQIRAQIGKGGDQLVPAILPQAEGEERASIAAWHDEIFASHFLERIPAFPGATDFVRYLHEAGYEVVLASSAKRREVEHYIRLLDIESCLTAITTADDVSKSKPAPDIFDAALGKLHSPSPEASCAVGDTPYDLIAASACKMPSIALLSGGFSAAVLKQERPRAIYADILSLWQACVPGSEANPTDRGAGR